MIAVVRNAARRLGRNRDALDAIGSPAHRAGPSALRFVHDLLRWRFHGSGGRLERYEREVARVSEWPEDGAFIARAESEISKRLSLGVIARVTVIPMAVTSVSCSDVSNEASKNQRDIVKLERHYSDVFGRYYRIIRSKHPESSIKLTKLGNICALRHIDQNLVNYFSADRLELYNKIWAPVNFMKVFDDRGFETYRNGRTIFISADFRNQKQLIEFERTCSNNGVNIVILMNVELTQLGHPYVVTVKFAQGRELVSRTMSRDGYNKWPIKGHYSDRDEITFLASLKNDSENMANSMMLDIINEDGARK